MLRTRTLAALAGIAVVIPIGAAAQAAPAQQAGDPAGYVNTFIGSTQTTASKSIFNSPLTIRSTRT